MGLEHSHQTVGSSATKTSGGGGGRSSSPRPSISSDSDIPYASYPINRPIGDSPKLHPQSRTLRGGTLSQKNSPKPPRPKSYDGHNIVVVKEGIQRVDTPETDPELCKLQSVPAFHPIMRGALSVPMVRDTEILEKLDYQSLYKLCLRYEEHLKLCSETVATEQDNLASRIREIDFAIVTLMNMMTERQKKYAKYAEKFGKVQEISSALKKSNMILKETIESMETLNALLPAEEQLEPFVWTTG